MSTLQFCGRTLVLCLDLYFFIHFLTSSTFLSSSAFLFSNFFSLLRILSSSADVCFLLLAFSWSRLAVSDKANPSLVLKSEAMTRKMATNTTRTELVLIFAWVWNMTCMLQTEVFIYPTIISLCKYGINDTYAPQNRITTVWQSSGGNYFSIHGTWEATGCPRAPGSTSMLLAMKTVNNFYQ